jgi:hypothetical protein
MKRTIRTEEQIIGILQEHEAGAKCAEPSGINRIYRLYREEGLTVRKRKARRRGRQPRQ